MSGSMLGLISLGPQGDAEAQERRAELVPATTGEVFGGAIAEGFQESVGPRMARIAGRGYLDQGDGNYAPLAPGQTPFDDLSPSLPGQLISAFRRAFPGEQPLPPSPMVPLDVLKREYEIPGVLSFDKDTPQSVAQSLYEHKRDQLARADAIRRADNMLTQGMAARFVGSMIGSLADPVNIAAMFVPGLRETTVARMMGVGPGASALARAGVRAGAGASAGAAGMIALEPLNAVLMAQERDDWTMAGALANVLFGTVAGAGFHSGLGALAERTRGLPEWAPARVFSEQMQNAAPEVQEALARSTMASTIEGRPVVAADLLELHTALEREAAALRGEAAAVPLHGLDEITVARIQDVEAALAETAITAERRATLEAELAMLTEGQNPEIVALERARSEAQRQGLETAAARTEARFAEVDRQLDEATRPRSRGLPDWAPARAFSEQMQNAALATEYRGSLELGHGRLESYGALRGAGPLERFSAPGSVDPEIRYDGTGGVFGGDGVYLDNAGTWTGGKVDRFDVDTNYKVQAPFERAYVITPDNLDDLIRRFGLEKADIDDLAAAMAATEYRDGAPIAGRPPTKAEWARLEAAQAKIVAGHSIAEKLKKDGYDGIIVQGFDDIEGTPRGAEVSGKLDRAGIVNEILQDQVFHFYPERVRVEGRMQGAAQRVAVEPMRSSREIMQDMEAAQRPNPADAMPPAATTRTGGAPPDPKPPGEIGAVAKDIAEIEKQTADLDALLKVQGDERLAQRIKDYDAKVDEETKIDTALFDAAAACIVRNR